MCTAYSPKRIRQGSEKTNQTRREVRNQTIRRHRWDQRNDSDDPATNSKSNPGDPGGLREAHSDAKHRSEAARTGTTQTKAIPMLRAARRQGKRVAISKQSNIQRSRSRTTTCWHIQESRNATPRKQGKPGCRNSGVYWKKIRIWRPMRGMESLETSKRQDRLRLVLGGQHEHRRNTRGRRLRRWHRAMAEAISSS